jgi:hypothetical protein
MLRRTHLDVWMIPKKAEHSDMAPTCHQTSNEEIILFCKQVLIGDAHDAKWSFRRNILSIRNVCETIQE